MPAPAPLVVGRYALYGVLASGGMASVHLGRLLGPVGFSPPVAVKRLHASIASDRHLAAMFADEARLAAHVHHPNVVPTLDVVSLDGEILLVMEYVPGESLQRVLVAAAVDHEPIPLPIVAAVCHDILQGLHAAHEAKDDKGRPLAIVHRDVTPHNVIVGIDGITRVLDFGIARAAGQVHTTREGHLKGKLRYMAPEQFRGERIDRRADVYGVGVVMWEMLTLKDLFPSDTEANLFGKIMAGASEAPSEHAAGIPPGVDALVMRALAPEATDRFATARDMARAIEECMLIASAFDVGPWLESQASGALERRAAQCSEIQTLETQTSLPVAHAVSRSGSWGRPRRTGARALAVGAGLLVIGTVVAGRLAARGPAPSSAPASTTAPSASEAEAVAPSATRPADPPTSSGATADPPPTPASPAPRRQPRPRAECDTPYWYDSAGIKRYKINCQKH